MTKEMQIRDFGSVKCPKCNAQAGYSCVSKSGKATYTHLARKQEWRRINPCNG